MASKHKQEDPWAGFVDVLSNILMVVIFLVVILGMAIFALSQQITKVAVENAVKAEREAQATPTADPQPRPPEKTDEAVAAAPKPEPQVGAAGAYEAAKAPRARETDEVAGNTTLSVRSLAIKPGKEVEIASEETKQVDAPVVVKQSHAFLTLKFGKGAFKIDTAASGEIQTFLAADKATRENKLEVRAFAQSTVGSVSEARRIAYYRAMQTRTELVRSGVAANRIEVKIRESLSPEEIDVVRIFEKPS